MESFKLNTIEEAVEDFGKGKFVIVVDDEDRENEGDLIIGGRPHHRSREDHSRESELHAEERPWRALRSHHHRAL